MKNLTEKDFQITIIADFLQTTKIKRSEMRAFLKDKTLQEILVFKKEVEKFIFGECKEEKGKIKDLFNLNFKMIDKYFYLSDNENVKFNYGIQGIHVFEKEFSDRIKDKKSYVYKIDCIKSKIELIFDKDIGWYDAKSISLAILSKINNEYNEDLDIGPKDIHYLKDNEEIDFKNKVNLIKKLANKKNGESTEADFIELWNILFGKKETDCGLIKYKNEYESDNGEYSFIITPREIAGYRKI